MTAGSNVASPSTLHGVHLGQKYSHRSLSVDLSGHDVRAARSYRSLDAIVVPTIRPADQIRHAIEIAAAAGCQLVVLASRAARVSEIADTVAVTDRSDAIIVDIPDDYEHPYVTHAATRAAVARIDAGRNSDLSIKRNLGLLLARLRGWHKIMFLDDDVKCRPVGITRVARQLDRSQIAGLICNRFPDNSVVCHASRLSGRPQDTFVTGAALGVNTSDLPLPYFPDIYNEDWFFFYERAAARELPSVGYARQRPYEPYDTVRASREEFGDLLAEGLYAHVEAGGKLGTAGRRYWSDFIDARWSFINVTRQRLERMGSYKALRACVAISGAAAKLHSIEPDDCVTFLDAWQNDRKRFAAQAMELADRGSFRAAFDELELYNWRFAKTGSPNLGQAESRPLCRASSPNRQSQANLGLSGAR
jgi:hypothetical protein